MISRISQAIKPSGPPEKNPGTAKTERGSCLWIPFASYCTTSQFMKLHGGYRRHCGPTAAVNVIRTMENRILKEDSDSSCGQGQNMISGQKMISDQKMTNVQKMTNKELFLLCAGIGRRTHIYWNTEILGRFGGTSNFLTGIFLRSCLKAAGLGDRALVRFHPWITPDAVEKALDKGSIVLLQVYQHPKYKNHHMLCYGCERSPEGRKFLLADGWRPEPVWTEEKALGRGHYLTITPK